MSNRIKITLPEQIAEQLEELAAAEGEPVARVTARLVRERLSRPTVGDPRVLSIESPARPPWLEPYGGSREWRQRKSRRRNQTAPKNRSRRGRGENPIDHGDQVAGAHAPAHPDISLLFHNARSMRFTMRAPCAAAPRQKPAAQ